MGASLTILSYMQFTRIRILSDNRTFDGMQSGKLQKTVNILGEHRQGHALLGFRNPYLPLIQTFIF